MGGLAMGAYTLAIFSEVYLQPWEHIKIIDTLLKTRLEKICCGNKIYVTQWIMSNITDITFFIFPISCSGRSAWMSGGEVG